MQGKMIKNINIFTVAFLLFIVCILSGCSEQAATYHLDGAQPDAPVLSDGGIAIKQGDHVYYLNGDNYVRKDGLRLHSLRGAICRMNADGTDMQILCDDDVSLFNLKGDTIWYAASKNNSSAIYKIKTDGSGKTKLCDMDYLYNGGQYAYTNGGIYYTKSGLLYLLDANGNSKKLTDSRICNLTAGETCVYYTDYANDKYGAVYMLKNGWDTPQKISTEAGYAISCVKDKVYFQLYSNGICYLFDPDSNTTASVAHLGYEDYAFDRHTGYIYASYLSDDKDEGIFKIDPKNESGRIRICTDRAERMLVSGDYVYYINDSALYSLFRVKTDGTERRQITQSMTSSAVLLDIVDNWLYYFNDSDESRIYRINLDTLNYHCIEYENISQG